MAVQPANSAVEESVDWKRIIDMLFVYKWLVVLTVIVAIGSAGFFQRNFPSYKASGVLLVHDKDNNLMEAFAQEVSGIKNIKKDTGRDKYLLYLNNAPFFTRAASTLLSNPEMQEKFGSYLSKVQTAYEKGDAARGVKSDGRWLSKHLNSISTISGERTNTITIEVRAPSRELAEDITNHLLSAARQEIILHESREIENVKSFIADRIETTQLRMKELEQATLKLYDEQGKRVLPDEGSFRIRVSEVDRERIDANVKIAHNKKLIEDLQSETLSGDLEINRQAKIYELETANKALAIKAEVIGTFLEDVLKDKGSIFRANQAREKLVRRSELELAFMLELQKRLASAEIEEISLENRVSVLTTVAPGDAKEKYPFTMMLAFGAVGGILSSVCFIYMMYGLFPRITSQTDLDLFGVKFLGAVPIFNKRNAPLLTSSRAESLLIFQKQLGNSFECRVFQQIRLAIIGNLVPGVRTVVSCVGPQSGVGKSFLSANIASAMVDARKKTLLIDSDWHVGMLTKSFNMVGVPGLLDLIEHKKQPHECMHRYEDTDLYIMPAGVIGGHGKDLAVQDNFASTIEKAMAGFDFVVIDTAPYLSVPDSYAACEVSDMVVLVSAHHKTKHSELLRFVRNMPNKNNKQICGIINKAKGLALYELKSYGYGSGRYYQVSKQRKVS